MSSLIFFRSPCQSIYGTQCLTWLLKRVVPLLTLLEAQHENLESLAKSKAKANGDSNKFDVRSSCLQKKHQPRIEGCTAHTVYLGATIWDPRSNIIELKPGCSNVWYQGGFLWQIAQERLACPSFSNAFYWDTTTKPEEQWGHICLQEDQPKDFKIFQWFCKVCLSNTSTGRCALLAPTIWPNVVQRQWCL